jgi:hypothetical protein
MPEKLLSKLGLTVALWYVLGAASASANVIYDYNYNFRFFSTFLEYSSPVYITTPTDVPLAELSAAFCTLGCAASYHFEPGSSNTLGLDVAFGNLFPAGALTHNGTYDMTIFFDSLTVSGSPSAPTVPEPASAALAAVGLALCAIRIVARRRKNAPGIPL